MVVKSLEFVVRGKKGLVQPAVKCRGPEYLRIIYGPEYDAPGNLDRLRSRGLAAKRSLAVREFALGIEALERFVRREPLRRVHECTFGVLAAWKASRLIHDCDRRWNSLSSNFILCDNCEYEPTLHSEKSRHRNVASAGVTGVADVWRKFIDNS